MMHQGHHPHSAFMFLASSMGGMRVAACALFAFFMLSLLPLVMITLSGRAAAGASAGFMEPLQTMLHIVFFVMVGLISALQARTVLVALPLACGLMLAIGGLTDPAASSIAARVVLFGCVLLFAVSMSLTYTRVFLLCASGASALAYLLGTRYMATLPEVGSPVFYLAGVCACVALLMGCGASVGVVLRGYVPAVTQRLQRV